MNGLAETATVPWFALRVRSRHENLVATLLDVKGYEWFLPTYVSRRQWSDRIKQMELPLFPGYLFCRFNAQERLPILKTPSVISVVGIANNPIPVDEEEIAALRVLVRSGVPREPCPFLRAGQRVRIERGALSGLDGVLLEFRGRHRIVLSVTLLQRSVAVEIDSAWVKPCPQQRSAAPAREAIELSAY